MGTFSLQTTSGFSLSLFSAYSSRQFLNAGVWGCKCLKWSISCFCWCLFFAVDNIQPNQVVSWWIVAWVDRARVKASPQPSGLHIYVCFKRNPSHPPLRFILFLLIPKPLPSSVFLRAQTKGSSLGYLSTFLVMFLSTRSHPQMSM